MADTQPSTSTVAPPKRGFQTLADMLRSMLPLLVVALILALIYLPRGEGSAKRIDPTVDVQSAVRTVGYPVLAPSGLSDDWVPTSSKLLRPSGSSTGDPNGLTIGYVTPDEEFVRYTQQRGLRADVLSSSLTGASVTEDPAGDEITLDGRVWTPVATSKGSALVSTEGTGEQAVVMVIAGTADRAELLELAGSLRPATD